MARVKIPGDSNFAVARYRDEVGGDELLGADETAGRDVVR